jgi:hypothetical protein
MTLAEIDAAVMAAVKVERPLRGHCGLRWIRQRAKLDKDAVKKSLARMRQRGELVHVCFGVSGWAPADWVFDAEAGMWRDERGLLTP